MTSKSHAHVMLDHPLSRWLIVAIVLMWCLHKYCIIHKWSICALPNALTLIFYLSTRADNRVISKLQVAKQHEQWPPLPFAIVLHLSHSTVTHHRAGIRPVELKWLMKCYILHNAENWLVKGNTGSMKIAGFKEMNVSDFVGGGKQQRSGEERWLHDPNSRSLVYIPRGT